jgi:hypothetical protein
VSRAGGRLELSRAGDRLEVAKAGGRLEVEVTVPFIVEAGSELPCNVTTRLGAAM